VVECTHTHTWWKAAGSLCYLDSRVWFLGRCSTRFPSGLRGALRPVRYCCWQQRGWWEENGGIECGWEGESEEENWLARGSARTGTGMGLVAEAVAEAERQKHNLEALKGSECSPPDPKLGKIGEPKAERAGSAGNEPGQADQPADPTCRPLTLAHSHFKPPVRFMRC
jgi:hypothetical protein